MKSVLSSKQLHINYPYLAIRLGEKTAISEIGFFPTFHLPRGNNGAK